MTLLATNIKSNLFILLTIMFLTRINCDAPNIETLLLRQYEELRLKKDRNQQEEALYVALNNLINNSQGSLSEKFQGKKDKEAYHLPSLAFVLKAAIITTTSVIVFVGAVELLRLMLKEEFILGKLKRLRSNQKKIAANAQEAKEDIHDIKDIHEETLEGLSEGIDKTGNLMDAVAELARSRENEERLASAHVDIFRELSKLKLENVRLNKRLNSINENSFLSLSEALASTPPQASPHSPERRNSIACDSPLPEGKKRSLSFIFNKA